MTDKQAVPLLTKGRDHRSAPCDMDADYLLELSLQLRARCCMHNVSRELFERAKELEVECLRRMTAASGDAQTVPRITREALRRELGEEFTSSGAFYENQIIAALKRLGVPVGE